MEAFTGAIFNDYEDIFYRCDDYTQKSCDVSIYSLSSTIFN